MAYVIIRHKVQDYGRWKPLYDEHQSARKEHGVKYEQLFRNTEDPNDITLLFEVSDINKIREFMESDNLKDAMLRAGVIGMPESRFLEEVEAHDLIRTSM